MAIIGEILDEIFNSRHTCYVAINVNNRSAFCADPENDMDDSLNKRAKFRSLAESRTNRAIESIGRLGNLANRQLYEYEEAEVKKILRALRASVAEVESRFAMPGKKRSPRFTL